jgi:hypothetical protein
MKRGRNNERDERGGGRQEREHSRPRAVDELRRDEESRIQSLIVRLGEKVRPTPGRRRAGRAATGAAARGARGNRRARAGRYAR